MPKETNADRLRIAYMPKDTNAHMIALLKAVHVDVYVAVKVIQLKVSKAAIIRQLATLPPNDRASLTLIPNGYNYLLTGVSDV